MVSLLQIRFPPVAFFLSMMLVVWLLFVPTLRTHGRASPSDAARLTGIQQKISIGRLHPSVWGVAGHHTGSRNISSSSLSSRVVRLCRYKTVDWKPIPLVDNKILSFICGGFARGILLVIKGGGDPYTDPYTYRGNAPPNYVPPVRPGYFNSRPPPSIDEESPPSFTSGSEIKIPRPKVYR
ncbi:Hypp9369 [Branchiostoma lanceolatum]|uniref:Hypp9369 protein n=1 Tax=Branchiostoma lanceolatum TaxID=7740 RepID=A0A8S4MM26_BRALA|nr:Hypp9369 [Branchiostoma lanceolatum]